MNTRSVESTPSIESLVENLAAEIVKEHGAEALRVTQIASDHKYACRCAACLSWWAYVGPDGGDPGDYGPFTATEVNAEQSRLGLQVTP